MYLREQGIDFEEKDVNESVDARRQFSRLRLPGVPSFLIGDQVVIGLDKEKILELCK
ncbi:glutaredoxin-related protein [Desulfitispora alkaliphila]